MADEDITLDGKPLQSLRVADLKAALEQRNLSKSGQKNTLIKRLKGALMLENLQKSSSSHCGLQPNSQIGQEMSQNSFIQQYLAKQQELLRQRLEREAQQNEEANDSPAVVEDDEDQSEDNDSSLHVSNKHSQPSVTRVQEKGDPMLGPGITGPSVEVPGSKIQQSAFHPGHKEPPTPSPPRAIASLSVRVLAQPPAIPRTNEEGAAPTEPGSAHPVLHLSRSAGGHADEDSDAEDSDDAESEDDEDWGPGPGGARRGNRAPPPPQQMPPSMPSTFARSKRKLQPPQHIPPPPAHHAPMQLRHPTPPPSPPPNLFPLPDTPKQSPPDTGEQEGEGARAPRGASFAPPDMQNKDSDSSSCSSSPEPSAKRKPGPLSLLVQKMESEGAFHAGEESTGGPASSSKSPPHMAERRTLQESQGVEEVGHFSKKERQQEKIEEQEEEKKSLQEDTKEEGKRLKEEKLPEEKKSQDEQKAKEEKPQKQKEEPENGEKKGPSDIQNLDSSSDSDSKSDSSSGSSSSSSSSEDKSNQLKKPDQDQKVLKTNLSKGDKIYHSRREVSPSAPAVTEMEAESEGSVVSQPPPGTEPENREGCTDEIADPAPKTFAARKISLTSNKTPPANADGGMSEADAGSAAGRKRRWGSSTSVIAKKPSISITTDSLKSLIPDIKLNQEAVVELHPEELQLSGDEENPEAGQDDQDKGLKIRRTVTQVVPSESHENGQTNEEEEMETTEDDSQLRASTDKRKNSVCEEASEAQVSVKPDGEAEKVTPSDSVVRRSISQQKSGVSITIDDPIRTTRQPSPSRGKLSNIVHVTNLVRPFTLGQLKELLNRTGTVVEEGFWIDKIKSHCFVTYATTEEAVATRDALHRVKWPLSNPKVLSVDFCEQDELDFHKGILKPEEKEDHVVQPSAPQNRLPPLMPETDRERDRERDKERERDRDRERERDRGPAGVRDLWAEREKEMQRRERARGEREWDRDKVREFARPGEEERRSRSRDRERRRRERGKSKERKTEKKEKADEPPAKLLDDLFLKTKAAPCIYWLPLTEDQVLQKVLDRTERQKERERRHKEQKEEEEKKREEEKKERLKVREKDGSATAGGGGSAARGVDGERDRGRDREGDKKRDGGHRPRRLSEGPVGLQRSRSRSNPRDRRR